MTLPSISDSDQYSVEPISPFGVLLRPAAGAEVTDLPIDDLRRLAREHHVVVLRGSGRVLTWDELAAYAERWGSIFHWNGKPIVDVEADDKPKDHVLSTTRVSFHWDSMYMDQVAEFQIFHSVRAVPSEQGGRTLFTDTTRVLEDASEATRAAWESLTLSYWTEKASHYGGTSPTSPLVVPHPDRGFPTMRYLEPVPDPVYPNRPTVTFHDTSDERRAELEQELKDTLYDPRHCYAHSWQTGDILIADNYTLLHAREAFPAESKRLLRRVHILGDPPLDNPALQHAASGEHTN
jgi:alpha-ketoglutarate-dependent taurine dioxygenase